MKRLSTPLPFFIKVLKVHSGAAESDKLRVLSMPAWPDMGTLLGAGFKPSCGGNDENRSG